MAVSGYVSVASGVGTAVAFSVSGTQTLAMAQAYAAAVKNATTFTPLNTAAGAMHGSAVINPSSTEYVLQNNGATSPVSATVPSGGGLVFDNFSGANTLVGSGSGDTVLVGAINAQATYQDQGGNNLIIFVEGNNTYDGTNQTGSDSIVAGSGFDVINTGTGNDTVNSGTGKSVITLNDTGAAANSGIVNDHVWLDDGTSFVYANGNSDGIVANSSNETIIGGANVTGFLNVVLDSAGSGLSAGAHTNDVVGLGSATTTLYDFTSGNNIYGGTGALTFVAGAGITANVDLGTGNNVVFGNANDTINIYTPLGTANNNVIVAGTGNETLYGGNSAGNQIFWAYQNTSAESGVYNEQITGGSGSDTFISGSGNETINSGAGTNLFVIHADSANSGAASNILINDFGANAANHVQFWDFNQSDVQAALDSATVTSGTGGTPEVIIQLGSSTTVTFVGVNSLNGHIG